MSNHSAKVIVNEFLRRRREDYWPQQLVLHKLAYIAHGWNLAINNEPLIDENSEAWDNGPVFRSVWNHIKKYGYKGEYCQLIDPDTKKEYKAELSQAEKAVIDHVWRKYREKNQEELINITHEKGTPWYRSYFGKYRNAPLDNSDIRQHYIDLAIAGRSQSVTGNP